jgi:hypothetical protein
MHALSWTGTQRTRERLRKVSGSPLATDVAAMDAIALRVLERMLGHPPTREDATLLPGIDVSDL